MVHAAQRREQTGVARGDQGAAAGAEDVKGVGIAAPPDVVDDQQDGLVADQFPEFGLAFVLGGDGPVAAQGPVHVLHPGPHVGQRAQPDPDNAVGERLAHLAIVSQGRASTTCRFRPCRAGPPSPRRR